jgi:hypothetical protein
VTFVHFVVVENENENENGYSFAITALPMGFNPAAGKSHSLCH